MSLLGTINLQHRLPVSFTSRYQINFLGSLMHCHEEWLLTGFGLEIGFTGHFNTLLVTIHLIIVPSLISTFNKLLRHTLSSYICCCVFTSHSLVTASNSGDSSVSVLTAPTKVFSPQTPLQIIFNWLTILCQLTKLWTSPPSARINSVKIHPPKIYSFLLFPIFVFLLWHCFRAGIITLLYILTFGLLYICFHRVSSAHLNLLIILFAYCSTSLCMTSLLLISTFGFLNSLFWISSSWHRGPSTITV
jgi:hypothetical protein